MGIKRKQIDWREPVGVQIRGINLNGTAGSSAESMANGTSSVKFYGKNPTQFNALESAFASASVNANLLDNVRKLTGVSKYNLNITQPLIKTTRGIHAFSTASSLTGTELVSAIDQFVEDPNSTITYMLNRIRIRDAITHNAIDDGAGNEVWGVLTVFNNAGTPQPQIAFYSGDPQLGTQSMIDVTLLPWWGNLVSTNNATGTIEIIINENVDYQDRPFAHNLRDIVNFYDVSVNPNSDLPVLVYTDSNPTNPIVTETPNTESLPLAIHASIGNTITVGIGNGVNYRQGSRVQITDNLNAVTPINGFITQIIADTITFDVSVTTFASVANLTLTTNIYEFTVADSLFTNANFNVETIAGDKSTIQASVNGIQYQVARNNIDLLNTLPTHGVGNSGGEVVTTDFYVQQGSATDFKIWWLDPELYAPSAARFDLAQIAPFDEVYFTIHFK